MKNAKKSMFITTILMVAVLIVAVSTATFAWYTASGTGTASQANLVAANSSAANVAVGWNATDTTKSITFSTSAVEVQPMCPTVEPALGMAFADLVLKTSDLDNEGKFNHDGGSANPWTVSNGLAGEEARNSFYIINYNANEDVDVDMTISYAANTTDNPETTDVVEPTVNYVNNNKLVVAVFVGGELAGIFTELSTYKAGTITQGNLASALPGTNAEITDTITIHLDKAPSANEGTSKVITIKAWLDGAALTQQYAGGLAAFSFDFTAQA